MKKIVLLVIVAVMLAGCSSEVGGKEEWGSGVIKEIKAGSYEVWMDGDADDNGGYDIDVPVELEEGLKVGDIVEVGFTEDKNGKVYMIGIRKIERGKKV